MGGLNPNHMGTNSFHKKALIGLILLAPGCQSLEKVGVSWELIGITGTRTHNKHVEEAQEFYQEGLEVQGKLGEAVDVLNQENINRAKADDDEALLERAYKNQVNIDMANEKNEELTKREFTKAEAPSFDFSSILSLLLAGLGGAGGVGMIALKMRGTIKNLAGQAIQNGQSTEVNDTKHLDKYK